MFRVLWQTIKDTGDELFALVGVNVLYLLINLPLMGLGVFFLLNGATNGALVLLLLSALTWGPANAGLYRVAQYVTEGRAIRVSHFIDGIREGYKLGWQVYGIWMAVMLLLVVNLRFYLSFGTTFGLVLAVVFFDLVLIWLGVLIYVGPLMVLQEDKRLRLIARNAALMTMGRPLFTLITLILMLIISAISVVVTILPLLITFSFLGIWGFRSTLRLIQDADERQLARDKKAGKVVAAAAQDGRGGQIRPK